MKHHQELQNLTLTTQPLKTLKYFNLAIGQYVRRFMARGGWFLLLIMLAGGIGVITMTIGGPQREVLTSWEHFSVGAFRFLVRVTDISLI